MSGPEQNFSFEPYYDSEDISPADALKLQRLFTEYRDATSALVSASTEETRVEAAGRLLKAQREISELAEDMNDLIYRVPVMVHVAGEPKTEVIQGHDVWVQRCSRCGSKLQWWYEGQRHMSFGNSRVELPMSSDDEIEISFDTWQERIEQIFEKADKEITLDEVRWWPVGKRVGRGYDDEDGRTTYYDLEDNEELNKHERMCVALNELFTGGDDGQFLGKD